MRACGVIAVLAAVSERFPASASGRDGEDVAETAQAALHWL